MNVLVSGASGLVGSALAPFLAAREHRVTRLVRRGPRSDAGEIIWEPDAGKLDAAAVEGFDGVVHLAGTSLAAGRWNHENKRRILDSRANGTALLARKLAGLKRPPEVLISASAVGYYGDRGEEALIEDSSPGSGFLADVCRRWEQAAGPVSERGIRLVALRMGMVLSAAGGALQRMLPPFRLGVGGRLASGNQYVSWIALDDLLEIILFALESRSLRGAINAVAPEPVTNRAFTQILGRVLRRPAALPIPAFAIRLMFGEMGDQLLLASTRVKPARLLAAGFRFRYPELEGALRHVLTR